IGCTVELGVVWAFSDAMNGLMALPNLIGLLVLSGLVARETRQYLKHDPKLRATREEIDAFMAGTPGWNELKTETIPGVRPHQRGRGARAGVAWAHASESRVRADGRGRAASCHRAEAAREPRRTGCRGHDGLARRGAARSRSR